MSDIEKVKQLRKSTGAGFKDCNAALKESNGDLDKAAEILRVKGIAKASKKSDRAANEGAVGIYSNEDITVILKLNSETDFAAKSDTFLNFLDTLGKLILENNNIIDKNQLLSLEYEKFISEDTLRILESFGHKLELSDTMGSTQSIEIIDGVRYGYADLRRPNAKVSVQQ